MSQKGKEPRSAVSVERAMEHGLLTIRRIWAGEVPDFDGWGAFELDPEPLTIHDLNGQALFYEFGVMDGKELVGSVRTSASKIVGSAVPAVQLGPRSWHPDRATRAAKEKVKERYPEAKVTATELVSYSYPKIGVRVYIEDPETERQSLIFDVATLAPVEEYGVDALEGFSSWSFYQEVAEPNAAEREQRWERADRELETARSTTPKILAPGFTARELANLRATFIPKPQEWQMYVEPIRPISWRVIRFSPRCNTHPCFELYSQKNDYYCAVATGQMILDFYRYYYTQAQIAVPMRTEENHGSFNADQVNAYEQLSNNCLNATYDSTADWVEAKAEIDANRPLKSGIPGHARACAGWMRENICVWPGPCRRWLKIYDPWPPDEDGNICKGGAIYWEDWEEEIHTNFIYVRHRTTPCP